MQRMLNEMMGTTTASTSTISNDAESDSALLSESYPYPCEFGIENSMGMDMALDIALAAGWDVPMADMGMGVDVF